EQLRGGRIRVTHLADVIELEHALARAFDDRQVASIGRGCIAPPRRPVAALATTQQQPDKRHACQQQSDDETRDPGTVDQSLHLVGQGFGPASRPAYQFTAYCISCAEVRSDSLRLMRWRCDSTVLTLRFSASAVCRVDRPLPIMCSTCSSRLVRLSTGLEEMYAPPDANFSIMLLPTASDT